MHFTSPWKPFFSVFSNIMVTVHCYQLMLMLTVIGHTVSTPWGNTVCFTPQMYCHSPLRSKHSFTNWHTLKLPSPLQLDENFCFYFITHPDFEGHHSLHKQCTAEIQQTYAHFEPDLCPVHWTFTQPSPAEATSAATLGSWFSSIPSLPKGPGQREGWGKGNWGNACFSSIVLKFIHSRSASMIVQEANTPPLSKAPGTHSVFTICGFIKPKRIMKALKRSSNTTLLQYCVFIFPV